ncbi:MAG: hydrogenase maturation nickel metallochaperone HypA [Dehalococcoidia bacterium]|jgi:hydrogenase nickel incorporation protein HypA/HybF
MHEVTIAREVAEKVVREAERANAKSVVAIEVELGDLTFLDPVSMEMWIRQALAEGPAEGAALRIDVARSTLKCNACGFQGPPEIPDHHDHHLPLPGPDCPRCGSGDVQLDGRTDCILKRIELEV